MSKAEILEKKPLALALVKEEIKRIKKRDGDEPGFRVTKTEEYVNEVTKLKAKEAKELIEKLEKLEVPRLKAEHMHKIADVLPLTDKHLKMLFQGYALTVSPDNVKKIFDVVQEYHPKK